MNIASIQKILHSDLAHSTMVNMNASAIRSRAELAQVEAFLHFLRSTVTGRLDIYISVPQIPCITFLAEFGRHQRMHDGKFWWDVEWSGCPGGHNVESFVDRQPSFVRDNFKYVARIFENFAVRLWNGPNAYFTAEVLPEVDWIKADDRGWPVTVEKLAHNETHYNFDDLRSAYCLEQCDNQNYLSRDVFDSICTVATPLYRPHNDLEKQVANRVNVKLPVNTDPLPPSRSEKDL